MREHRGQQRAQTEKGLPGGACVEGTSSHQAVTAEPADLRLDSLTGFKFKTAAVFIVLCGVAVFCE